MISFASPAREHAAAAGLIEQAVLRVLRSGDYILGRPVAAFEAELAQFTGSRFAVGLSSGTDAIVCALHALGVGPGDEVLVPAFGFVAAPEAVLRVGARPVFVDVEPVTLGPSPDAVRAARTDHTRAVIVMHLFGQAVDVEAVRQAAAGLLLIEDAAQAIGTRLRGAHVGTIADAGTLSFFPAKSLGAAGDAGAVITNGPELADAVKRARSHGAQGPYKWMSLGGNYRLDALQASILSVKLGLLPARLQRRRAIGATLRATIETAGARVFVGANDSEPTFAPLAMRVAERDAVHARLRELGIDARVQYPVALVDAPAFAAFACGDYPEAHRACRELVSIPCHPELTDDEVQALQQALSKALAHG